MKDFQIKRKIEKYSKENRRKISKNFLMRLIDTIEYEQSKKNNYPNNLYLHIDDLKNFVILLAEKAVDNDSENFVTEDVFNIWIK